MPEDYRCTKYCPQMDSINDKKKSLLAIIRQKHPRAKDIHAIISSNDGDYKVDFMSVYCSKCAYCGVSLDLIPKSSFEIDHFLYEKSARFNGSKAAAGYIENLVLSCHSCNHRKKDFNIPEPDISYLYPDNGGIKNAFFRDEQYYIKISAQCRNNSTVISFYNQLNLGSELHRIDYLLMYMIGFQQNLEDKPKEYVKLGQIIERLRKKRNIQG